MKHELISLIEAALRRLAEEGALPLDQPPIHIERTRDERHGHFASNVALALAKQSGVAPRSLAARVVEALPPSASVERVEVAGPGFINFHLRPAAFQAVVRSVMAAGERYGTSALGSGQTVQVEFVSANPTGPLHIGHGRGAAYGAALAAVLSAAGYGVQREYYVNDAGRQMDILALSVWLRYMELSGANLAFPPNAYRGDYVREIAARFRDRHGAELHLAGEQALPPRRPEDDDETALDSQVASLRTALGPQGYRLLHAFATDDVLADIKDDLTGFGVEFDAWFRESSLIDDGSVDRAVQRLDELGRMYVKDGARWFRSTEFGDEKDRVVVRENGQKTYFASDIAYHMHKYERGFDRMIDIWGADHHGYIPRVKAAVAALGADPHRLEVLLVQFATLYRGEERVQMSTRSGEFVTLRELREEVGRDAARFFYVMRKSDQHLDFDLELAKSRSNDNPVFYVQYAHARICSVFRQLEEQGMRWDGTADDAALALLTEPEEMALLRTLSRYPDLIDDAAEAREPHLIANYLRGLAAEFHLYYTNHKFLIEDAGLRDARLSLIQAARQVIRNALGLLGVSAPERM